MGSRKQTKETSPTGLVAGTSGAAETAESGKGSASPFELLRAFNHAVFFVGALLACVGMCALLIAGFAEMLQSVLVFFGALPVPGAHQSRSGAALELATKALEFFFLAPLAFALMMGVARYVEATTGSSPAKSDGGRSLEARQLRVESARAEVLVVKTFSASLFVAIFAAVTLGRALSEEGLDYEGAVCFALVVVALCAYLLILEHSSMEVRKYLAGSTAKRDEDEGE